MINDQLRYITCINITHQRLSFESQSKIEKILLQSSTSRNLYSPLKVSGQLFPSEPLYLGSLWPLGPRARGVNQASKQSINID